MCENYPALGERRVRGARNTFVSMGIMPVRFHAGHIRNRAVEEERETATV